VSFLAVLIHLTVFFGRCLAKNSLKLDPFPFCATAGYVSFLDRLLAW